MIKLTVYIEQEAWDAHDATAHAATAGNCGVHDMVETSLETALGINALIHSEVEILQPHEVPLRVQQVIQEGIAAELEDKCPNP